MFIIVEKIVVVKKCYRKLFVVSLFIIKNPRFSWKFQKIYNSLFCIFWLRPFIFDYHSRLRSFLSCFHDFLLFLFLEVFDTTGCFTFKCFIFPSLSQYNICLGVKKTKQHIAEILIWPMPKKNELVTILTVLIFASIKFRGY